MVNSDNKIEVDPTVVTEHKNSWMPWLLGVLGLLALLFIVLPLLGIHLFGAMNNQQHNTAMQPTPSPEVKVKQTLGDKPFADLAGVAAVSDKNSLDGKAVEVTHVKVSKVNGPETFFAGDNTQSQLFTVLDQKLDEQLDKNNTDAKEGQYVDLKGTLKLVKNNQVFSEYGFDQAETDLLHQQTMYLLVTDFKQSAQQ